MNYFEQNEHDDLQLFYEFNAEHRLFDSITPMRIKSQYDAIAVHKNRKFAVELKRRFVQLKTYDSVFIEAYKLAAMMLEYTVNHLEPLYICFLHDAVLIFNLLKLKTMPKLRILDIESKGYEKMQCQERRYLLDINDAVIYCLK